MGTVHSSFHWCKNYKNRPRDARVIVKNKWFLLLWNTVTKHTSYNQTVTIWYKTIPLITLTWAEHDARNKLLSSYRYRWLHAFSPFEIVQGHQLVPIESPYMTSVSDCDIRSILHRFPDIEPQIKLKIPHACLGPNQLDPLEISLSNLSCSRLRHFAIVRENRVILASAVLSQYTWQTTYHDRRTSQCNCNGRLNLARHTVWTMYAYTISQFLFCVGQIWTDFIN